MNIDQALLMAAFEASRDGIVITDASSDMNSIVYSNAAFSAITGFGRHELVGKGTRFLLGKKSRPTAAATFRQALREKVSCRVTLSAVCKNGSERWIEISGAPVTYQGETGRYFVGVCRDVDARMNAFEALMDAEIQYDLIPSAATETSTVDPVTTLYSRPYFEEVAERDWMAMEQERRPLSLFMLGLCGVDAVLNQTPGLTEDAVLTRVAASLRQIFRRGVDLIARFDARRFVVISSGLAWEEAEAMALKVKQMADTALLEMANDCDDAITSALGVATAIPEKGMHVDLLIESAQKALTFALQSPQGAVEIADVETLLAGE